jgi:hypothetical protein
MDSGQRDMAIIATPPLTPSPPISKDVLDLIEGRMGLMDLIDEACR